MIYETRGLNRELAVAVAALLLAPTVATAADWADLWQRPDQRAQKMLEAGQPAAAAPLFSDPRQQAYAEIKAKDYATAARNSSKDMRTRNPSTTGAMPSRVGAT